MKPMRRGQVLIEFALAALGVVAIAFVGARVVGWLNQSMVERNQNFQVTRLAAGSVWPGVGFHGPSNITLLGRTAGSTPRAGSSGADSFTIACAGAWGFAVDANNKRQEALRLLLISAGNLLPAVVRLHDDARLLVCLANKAWDDANQVDDPSGTNDMLRYVEDINTEIAAINTRLGEIETELNGPGFFSDPGSCGLTCWGCGDATCTGGVNSCLFSVNARIWHYAVSLHLISFCGTPACIAARACWTAEKTHLESMKADLLSRQWDLNLEKLGLISDRTTKRNRKRTILGRAEAIADAWRTCGVDPIGCGSIRLPVCDRNLPDNLVTRYNQQLASNPNVEPAFTTDLRNIAIGVRNIAIRLNNAAHNLIDQGQKWANAIIGETAAARDTIRWNARQIQDLIAEAERLEEQARLACQSDRD